MKEPIIDVINLSKVYKIGHRESYYSLRDTISNVFKKNTPTEEFCALDNVSFKVNEGAVIGIIGKNGAGKSTLLKILSRITPPTIGKITMRGRVASLLEVGTGFNPELTGRENIFLNGSIMGMTQIEIKSKFDEIVAFSGIERFLDTPVKRYSSGMYVRLAFAVAAHLGPEILLIDEVLAVGDSEFQKKCLRKMDDVSKSGRTILFVSHNMGAISALCPTSILLEKGKLTKIGSSDEIINFYNDQKTVSGSVELSDVSIGRTGGGPTKILKMSTLNDAGVKQDTFKSNEKIAFVMELDCKESVNLETTIFVIDEKGNIIINLNNVVDGSNILLEKGIRKVLLTLNSTFLNNGKYTLTVWVGAYPGILHDRISECISFVVENSGSGNYRVYKGLMHLPASWNQA